MRKITPPIRFLVLLSILLYGSCKTALPDTAINTNGISLSKRNLPLVSEEKTVYLSREMYSSDNTAYIQSLLDSDAELVIIPSAPGPWYTGPLFINRDNLTILFEPEARLEAREGLFEDTGDCLISITERKQISLIGPGGHAGLYMRKDDYQSSSYKQGEWRHCLSLRSTEDILVQGLALAESGGDGIYIGQSKRDETINYCLNTTIRDCRILNNHRQGISVISAENLLLENTLCWGTRGTLPKAGIDFEPNRATERFVNCRVINCRFEENAGPGIHIYLKKLNETSVPVDITLEGNFCRGNLLGIGINLTQLQNNPPGKVTLINNDFGKSPFNKIPRKRSIEVVERKREIR